MAEQINRELLEACKEALECITKLTPFPSSDQSELLNQAISQVADYTDSVRDKLRKAISRAESG